MSRETQFLNEYMVLSILFISPKKFLGGLSILGRTELQFLFLIQLVGTDELQLIFTFRRTQNSRKLQLLYPPQQCC